MPEKGESRGPHSVDGHISVDAPPTLDGNGVRALLKGAVLRGFDPEKMLKKAGLTPDIYTNPDLRIDGKEFQRLTLVLQGEMNDQFMGFMEQPAKLGLEGLQSPMRLQCSTLGELIRTGTQFRETVRSDISYEYLDDIKCREFELIIEYRTIEGVDRDLFFWHRLMAAYRYYCWVIGKRILLNRVCFEGPKPMHPDMLRRYSIFDSDVRFDQKKHSLAFDRKYLFSPIIRKDPADYIKDHPDWFAAPGLGASWTRQTEQLLLRMQRQGVWSPPISMVSAMLSMSAQTLRRKLAREGTSFSKKRAQLRCELARAYLVATDLPIARVGEEVGFIEPGDFTRSFVSWTGTTPSACRRRHAGDKESIVESMAVLCARTRNRESNKSE